MNTGVKVGVFVAGLCVVFGAAAAIGNAVGPVDSEPAAMEHGDDDAMNDMAGMSEGGDEPPGGLQVAQNGYRLVLDDPTQQPAPDAIVTFRVLGPDGKPVTDYAISHDKKLHFIAARRDLSGFQHVHPTLDEHGTWTARLALDAGQWRTFADFDPAGKDPAVTLGADLTVAGNATPKPLPAPSWTDTVGDYTVTLEGDAVAGEDSKLTLNVAKDGEPVTDLQPYLAAYGHLVALRDGDLAYLHVHPDGEPGDGRTEPGPGITFYASFPSEGRYRLYLDFKHGGVVRTAEFTVEAGRAGAATGTDDHSDTDSEHEH
ncbi:hypothetical protein ASE12_11355 [Aeromicrobium sp. Root236]|uniref:hypothetical protein n=1 Tax=Aeromicrobium sp. Root236 TaxID=1736498 RepID=UPI0006FD8555|nr:hypothetical protein [Aeromicrobium sp. Root236]KRC65307.1 hypothetical protein ASE12_11355 [Aeromicrobium sp. Root236]